MDNTIGTLTLSQLALSFIPVIAVLLILLRWSLGAGTAVYALARMLGQLLLIGYLLTFLFATERAAIIVLVLTVMVFASSWIALRTTHKQRLALFPRALLAVGIGGGVTLLLITAVVLQLPAQFHQAGSRTGFYRRRQATPRQNLPSRLHHRTQGTPERGNCARWNLYRHRGIRFFFSHNTMLTVY